MAFKIINSGKNSRLEQELLTETCPCCGENCYLLLSKNEHELIAIDTSIVDEWFKKQRKIRADD